MSKEREYRPKAPVSSETQIGSVASGRYTAVRRAYPGPIVRSLLIWPLCRGPSIPSSSPPGSADAGSGGLGGGARPVEPYDPSDLLRAYACLVLVLVDKETAG